MTQQLAPYFAVQFEDAPLGWLHTYASGTTTPKQTWQDQAGATPHTLPTAGVPASGINLDVKGRPPGGFFIGTGEYTFHLYSVAGTLIKSWDDVGVDTEDPVQREKHVATENQTVFTLTGMSYTPGINSLQVYTNGLLLTSADYTETSTTVVTLAEGAAVDDELVFIAGAAVNSTVVDDAVLVTYNPAGTGAAATNVQAKLRESISILDKGGDSTGATDAVTPFTNMLGDAIGLQVVTDGTFAVATDVTPAARDLALRMDPGVAFTGAGKVRLDNQIPFQTTPVSSLDLVRKSFDSSWAGYGNIFMRAAYAKSDLATVAVVAMFGGAEATAASGKCWGGNFVSYARNATAAAIGVEVNYGADVAGGSAYGVVIAAANTQATDAAIQIQSNTAAAQPAHGVNFNWRDPEGCVTDVLIRASGVSYALSTVERFLHAANITATTAEIEVPSFRVEATVSSTVNRVAIRGAATTAAPRVAAEGSDTNVDLQISGKGTGVAKFINNSVEQFRVRSPSGGVDNLQVGAGTGSADLSIRGTSTNADVNVVGKGTGGVKLADGAGTAQFWISTTGLFARTASLGDYADDAAAAAGGVVVGQLYRTTSTIKVRVA
jgi:hypothetical protein